MTIRSIFVFVNQKKQISCTIADDVEKWCKKNNIKCCTHGYKASRLDSDEYLKKYQENIACENFDLIVAIGGDGTLLRAARTFASLRIPILPICSGTVGFLMYIPARHALDAMDEIKKGKKWHLDKRLMLKASIKPYGSPIYALNEILISTEDRKRLSSFDVSIGGKLINRIDGDGIIISTASGSTAYNLSAGGPLMYPSNNSIILTPLCAHSISSRPIILKPKQNIQIKLSKQKRPLSVIADGQEIRHLKLNQTLVVKKSPSYLNLVRSSFAVSYFDALKQKLGWH